MLRKSHRWVDKPFAFFVINLAGDMTMSFE